MRVLTCLYAEHNYFLVMLAAMMCGVGSVVTTGLFRRCVETEGLVRSGWLFLTAVCAGSSIWATHFIAMLGYQASAQASFKPILTIASIIIAILGAGLSFAMASARGRTSSVMGGTLLGLAISAMHYAGMFAYRVSGLVTWDQRYILVSVLLSIGWSILYIQSVRRWTNGATRHASTGLLVLAIISLHFTGMAAFQVIPLEGVDLVLDEGVIQAMALAVLVAGLLVVGTGISSYLIDGRTRARSSEQLQHMAFHDPLTGLQNRRAFRKGFDEYFAAASPSSLLLIDLDYFKSINDNYGHSVGDSLLLGVAERLQAVLGDEALVARMGGDEFAALVFVDASGAEKLAQEVVRRLSTPFFMSGRTLTISCSVGVCSSRQGANVDQVVQQADIALYEAKRLGRRRAFRYQPGMLEEATRKKQLEADMREALQEKKFYLVYQPLVDITTSSVMGFEALLRWDHPQRGAISPASFVPLAEESGFISDLGEWVLREACSQAAMWDENTHVSVNVSPVQFRLPSFVSQVEVALSISGLPPHRLELELTETALVADSMHVAHVLGRLRELGIKVAMDDFGTGYSSLAHLRDLPLDRIKIDRSFVSTAAKDRNSMAVLRAITQLGRDMGIPTLGEGVETQEQLDLLQQLGCNAVQGYLVGKPRRAATVPAIAA
jgi:diguanylate cyclase (GGDEF)-like protein